MAVLVVVDISNEISIKQANFWVEEFRKHFVTRHEMKNPILIVLGNKCDLDDEREILPETGSAFAKSIGALTYMEVSAKTGQGIMITLLVIKWSFEIWHLINFNQLMPPALSQNYLCMSTKRDLNNLQPTSFNSAPFSRSKLANELAN